MRGEGHVEVEADAHLPTGEGQALAGGEETQLLRLDPFELVLLDREQHYVVVIGRHQPSGLAVGHWNVPGYWS